jgi:hypothetical protein
MPFEPVRSRASGRVRRQAACTARQRPRRSELAQRRGRQSAGGHDATRQAAPDRRAIDGYRIRLTIPGDLPALTGLLQAA